MLYSHEFSNLELGTGTSSICIQDAQPVALSIIQITQYTTWIRCTSFQNGYLYATLLENFKNYTTIYVYK